MLRLILSSCTFLGTFCVLCQSNDLQSHQVQSDHWNAISSYFHIPEEFRDSFGNFKSPLVDKRGVKVDSPEGWKIRRKEILSEWHALMGPWPELIVDRQLEIVSTEKRENFTQHQVRFSWVPGELTEGYLLVPGGSEGLKPAVISVYYEPETAIGLGNPYRDYAYQLVKRGFVTLSIGTKEATAQKNYALYYPSVDHASVQPLSMLAYAAANAWEVLARVEGVDSARIGIVGHSFGGKWAMFASCLYEKFACAVWSDPGIVLEESRPSVNYWEPWYLGYQPKPWRERGMITVDNPAKGLYPVLRSRGFNLTDLHALMAPRPFLVSGGSEDPPERWIALNHAVHVNKLLGFEQRVGMTNREEHSPDQASNEIVYQFFEYFLKY
ncbi:MAG: sialidase [Saprospiraceae bacterium]|nr:sialidase [Saprospiraceae bacterium]